MQDDLAVADVTDRGLPELDIDGADAGEITGCQASVFTRQVDQSLEIGDLGPAEIIVDIKGIDGGHVDGVVDIEGPVVSAIAMSAMAIMGMDLADFCPEFDQVSPICLP